MRSFGLGEIPIVMAGGVWYLREWEDWIDNPDLGPIAFQFGTRPLLTQESPISDAWREKLRTLQPGDVSLNKFSPTGFYSSAVINPFLEELAERAEHQVAFSVEPVGDHTVEFPIGRRGRVIYLTEHDRSRAEAWVAQGFTQGMKTPDNTVIFVTPENANEISDRPDQLHGLPVGLPILELVAERVRHHRQEGRSTVLLHPEDAAEYQPFRRCSASTDVRRP